MAIRHSDSFAPLGKKRVRDGAPEKDTEDVAVVHSRLEPGEPLELDDNEFGGDPYNSTGRFSALVEEKIGRGD